MAINRLAFETALESDGSPNSGDVIGKAQIAEWFLDPMDDEIARLEDDIAAAGGGAPAAHATTHQSGGSDALKLDDLSAPDDNTDLNVSTTKHGLFPKLPGGTTNFWREDGTWQAAGGGGLSNGSNYINDSSNANMTIGLTINQGANDDEILALKSSDVAHGVTAETETDTFATIKKQSDTLGGLMITGYTEGDNAFDMKAVVTSADTTKATNAAAPFRVTSYKKSGTGLAGLGANGNIAAFADQATVRFILDADGDSHQDVGTAWTNFDSHDDVALLQTLAAHVSQLSDPLRAGFAGWLEQSREPLERLRLVTFNDDGHHFVNMSRLTMLLVGATRQLGQRMTQLETRLLALEDGRG
jgi:hypothetical protein